MNTKITLTTAFAVSIAIANVTAAKLAWIPIPEYGSVAVPAGFIAFSVAFLCSDLLVEFYGKDYAARVVNATVGVLVLAYGLVWVSIQLPSAPFYDASAFHQVLGSSASIVAASVTTILVSQHADVRIFASIKSRTGNRLKFVRNCVSTALSQSIDTVLFITLAFTIFPYLTGGDVMLGNALVSIIVGQYLAKLAIVLIDTPFFYAVTAVVDYD